ncbi:MULTISPECIES: T9SS type A sorting domain-containing protein [Flavobacterium]|uniref:T9SS type A sorting domain-containing protein n=1 Tax=Flavobacterium TaxID=237 RepID=UPI001FCAD11E|nr:MULTISPECIES: T9SS type A sorting domain-containing protein [Flavobacterium]UOK42249.1 T9SS type A sorting domain-containing protein [Flavobacterium enshiense]
METLLRKKGGWSCIAILTLLFATFSMLGHEPLGKKHGPLPMKKITLGKLSPTIYSDRADYQPGDTLRLSGSGWQPGETVTLHFDESPTVCPSGHNRFTVADANGNIFYDLFYFNDRHLGVTFVVTATGQTSGLAAQTTFTDGLLFTASIASTPSNLCSGASANYSITVTNLTTAQPTGNNARAGSFRIAIPAGFTSVSNVATSLPAKFSAIFSSGNIDVNRTGGASNGLGAGSPGESIVITFTATAPVVISNPYIFTTTAWVGNDFSTTQFPALANQPQVNINSAPSIISASDIFVSNQDGLCSSSVSLGSNITLSGNPSPTLSYSLSNFGGIIPNSRVFPVGETTVYVKASNSCGEVIGSFKVAVTDNENPVLTPGSDQDVVLGSDCKILIPDVSGSATDNCSGVIVSQSPEAGSSVSSGHNAEIVVTVTATDAAGLTDVEYVKLTAKDVTSPVISPISPINVGTDDRECSALVSITAPSASDNCNPGTALGVRSDSQALNAAYPKGVTTITWSYSDGNGNNAAAVQQTVTVNDEEAPEISAVSPISVGTDDNSCSAIVNITAPSASDNCNPGTASGVRDDGELLSAAYPKGVTTITWTYSDGNGNDAVAVEQTVTVSDDQAPQISAVSPIIVGTDDNSCSAIVNITAPSASDNCNAGTASGVRDDGELLSAAYPKGVTTITWTYSDGNGNDAVAVEETVTVSDDQAPQISAVSPIIVGTDDNSCSAIVNITVPSASDNCNAGTASGVRDDGELLSAAYPKGVTTITWTYSDGNGNDAVAVEQTVTVSDDQAPQISAVSPISVGTDDNSCSAIVNITAPSASDNCNPGTASGVRDDGELLTAAYPKGTTTITWSYSDGNGNDASEVEQTVTVSDDQAPEISAVSPISVGTDDNSCSAIVNITAPSASDNCNPGTASGVRDDGELLTAAYPKGTTTITWSYSDGNGNDASEVEQTVTVSDDQAPEISAVSPISVGTDDNSCSAIVNITAPSASDNCNPGTASGVRDDGELLTAAYPKGTTTITWSYSDGNGNNAAAVQQTVTVNDEEAPEISPVSAIEVGTDDGECSALVSITAPSASDNCNPGIALGVRSDSQALNAAYPKGVTTITWSYSDGNGNNAAAVQQTVTVNDEEAPEISAVSAIEVGTYDGECSALVSITAPSASDNCNPGTASGVRSDSQALNAAYPKGVTTITWSYSDGNGNDAVAVEQTVTVSDDENPVIVCQDDIHLSACEETATWSAPVASDNCSVSSVIQTSGPLPDSNTIFAIGTSTPIIYKATDTSGNVTYCSFNVIRDSELVDTSAGLYINDELYFGYAQDQSCEFKVTPQGGKGPYKVVITMSRALKCNQVNDAGDEKWTCNGVVGTTTVNTIVNTTGNTCLAFPLIASSTPVSTIKGIELGSSCSVSAILMEDAIMIATITDDNGCVVTTTKEVKGSDVRCFNKNSTREKVSICHKTGSGKNPCVQICVDYDALEEHLAHGDYVGKCLPNCIDPAKPDDGENVALFNVKAYPNPSNNQFTFEIESESSDDINISVLDISGRLIKEMTNVKESKVTFGESLPRGVYFAMVQQGNNQKTIRIVKE